MWLLPYQKLRIRTYLTPNQVYQKLKKVVRPNPPILSFFGSSAQPYYGKIGENYFKIYRIISYRNSFLPSVEGEIQATGVGSVISVTIQSDRRVLGFFMIITIIVPFFVFDISGELMNFITHPGSTTLFSLFTRIFWISFLLVSSYGMILLFYYYEAAKAKSFLSKLLKESDNY